MKRRQSVDFSLFHFRSETIDDTKADFDQQTQDLKDADRKFLLMATITIIFALAIAILQIPPEFLGILEALRDIWLLYLDK